MAIVEISGLTQVDQSSSPGSGDEGFMGKPSPASVIRVFDITTGSVPKAVRAVRKAALANGWNELETSDDHFSAEKTFTLPDGQHEARLGANFDTVVHPGMHGSITLTLDKG